jgi:hypothetical protein
VLGFADWTLSFLLCSTAANVAELLLRSGDEDSVLDRVRGAPALALPLRLILSSLYWLPSRVTKVYNCYGPAPSADRGVPFSSISVDSGSKKEPDLSLPFRPGYFPFTRCRVLSNGHHRRLNYDASFARKASHSTSSGTKQPLE